MRWFGSVQHYTERKNETFLICCEWALSSGYHLAWFLHSHGDRPPVKLPCNPLAAQLLWEKVHWSTPSCSPLLFLPSPFMSPCFIFFFFLLKVVGWIFPNIGILIEIHVIYVWKRSRWTWHLILCWSNALNFNLCSATCFFTLSKPQ